ncbi:MAG: D-glycerate dehydrogenase, partial [Chloroflexi bacterium]|nr:D-glycerate dehydrogenase [Chloroflexota bacterium]
MTGGRPRVFIARAIPDDGIAPLVAACDARVWENELPPPRAELLRAIEGCDGVLTLLTDRVDDEFLDAAGPQLKVVSNYAVGFDNVDVAACTRRGIPVGNTP